jgi:hypothetical protein
VPVTSVGSPFRSREPHQRLGRLERKEDRLATTSRRLEPRRQLLLPTRPAFPTVELLRLLVNDQVRLVCRPEVFGGETWAFSAKWKFVKGGTGRYR